MTNNNTNPRTFKHLTPEMRGRLQAMYEEGSYTQTQMAQKLGVSQSTISRELKRGMTQQMDYDRKYYKTYLAESASRVYQENRQNCRSKGIQAYSPNFIAQLEEALLAAKHERIFSVDTFVYLYRKNNPLEHVPCTKTVYNWIDQGYLEVKNIDLPMKVRLRSRNSNKKPRGTNQRISGRSIETRCESVLNREVFGHWELDLVIGKKTKGEPCIITLIERKTRKLLTKKVWGRDAKSIEKHVLKMIMKEGIERFKSITTDNGSEFSTLSNLEAMTEETQIFFTHAYAAWEKGTNERHNRMLREFIPKGQSLKSLTYRQLAQYTEIINRRYRKILDYRSPEDLYEEEIKKLVA